MPKISRDKPVIKPSTAKTSETKSTTATPTEKKGAAKKSR
jgi:hypothetical protein